MFDKRAQRGLCVGLTIAGLYGVALICQPAEPATSDLWQRQLGTAEDDALRCGFGGQQLGGGWQYARAAAGCAGGERLSDGYIVQSSLSGQIGWQKQLGTAGTDEWRGVASDASGNVYVVGFTDNTFAGQTRAGG